MALTPSPSRAKKSDRIQILIVDDQALFRDGLCALINAQEDMVVVGEAGDGFEAIEQAARLEPDIILMDINMPRLDGVEATGEITAHYPQVRVIVLTMHSDEAYVFEAIKAGASGYVLKYARSTELLQAIRAVHRGEVMIEPKLASQVLNEFQRLADGIKERRFIGLSFRERQLLELVAAGKTNKEIADQLFLAEQTVKNRLSAIYRKLNVNNRAEAATWIARGTSTGKETPEA